LFVQLALSITACRRHGLHLHGLGAPLWQVTAACAVMVAGVLLLRAATNAWQDWPALRLGCEIALGAMLYPAALALLGRGLLQDVMRLLGASGKAERSRAGPWAPSPGISND
jgi:hypothetical protein